MFLTTPLLALLASTSVVSAASTGNSHCYPATSCWPTLQDFFNLQASLDGTLISPESNEYRNLTLMKNTRVTRIPYICVLAKSVGDVIDTVKFAKQFNMKLTVWSSGHDYIGRSAADMSIQINLSDMTELKFDLNSSLNQAGVVTAQSGNSWIRVYNETHKVGRVIVGGSAHTVSMGGYTLGGGHAPIGRMFGMAVDNLLAVQMVTADGTLVYANATSTTTIDRATGQQVVSTNTDIFWALRGGGGSTFGIVTEFTYKLHYDSKMVTMSCYFPLYDIDGKVVARPYLQQFNNILGSTLAPEWGGYQIYSNSPVPPLNGKLGAAYLVLNHFGPWGSTSFNTLLPFISHVYTYTHCEFKNVSSFLDYESTSHIRTYYAQYIFNTLMQPDSFTDQFYDYVIDDLVLKKHAGDAGAGCMGTLIGGNMKQTADDATAVNPNFRSAVMSMTCAIFWDSSEEDKHVAAGEQLTTGLRQFGQGVYFNEPSAYLPDWKTAYWGNHYDRLLSVKKVWDPTNFFTCLHCVGSDMNMSQPDSPSTGGTTASNVAE